MLARGGLLLFLAGLCTGALVDAQAYPTNTVVCSPQPATFSGVTLPTPDPTAAPGSPTTTHVCGTTSMSTQCVCESEPAGLASTTAAVTHSSSCGAASAESCCGFTAPALTGLSASDSDTLIWTVACATARLSYVSVQPVIVAASPTMGLVGTSTDSVDLMIVAGLDSQVQSASDVSVSFAGLLSSAGTKLTFNKSGYAAIRTAAPLSSLAKAASIQVVASNAYSSVTATTAQTCYGSSVAAQVHAVIPSSGAVAGGTQISLRLKGTTYSGSAVSAQFALPSGTTAAGPSVLMYGDDLTSIQAPAASPSGETGASTVKLVIGSCPTTFPFTYEVPITSAGAISFVRPRQASIGGTVSIVASNCSRIDSATDVGVTVGPATADKGLVQPGAPPPTKAVPVVEPADICIYIYTAVYFQSASGSGSLLSAFVRVTSMLGPSSPSFSYVAPVVARVSLCDAATSGGSSVTSWGVNFGSYNFTPSGCRNLKTSLNFRSSNPTTDLSDTALLRSLVFTYDTASDASSLAKAADEGLVQQGAPPPTKAAPVGPSDGLATSLACTQSAGSGTAQGTTMMAVTARIGVTDSPSGSANVLPGMPTTTVVTAASIEKLGTTTSTLPVYVMNGASVAGTSMSTIGGGTTVAATNLANTTISTQYPTFGSGTCRPLRDLGAPMLATSLTSTSIGTAQGRIVEKNAATGAFTSTYYDLDVLDKDFSNVVERVTPSSIDVNGGSSVTATIYKFNNGTAVTAAQPRVLFCGASAADAISAISTSTRTTATLVAPASEDGLATGFVVPSIAVSNFPVISFATEARVRFVVGASAAAASSARPVRSAYQSPVLLVPSPIAAAA